MKNNNGKQTTRNRKGAQRKNNNYSRNPKKVEASNPSNVTTNGLSHNDPEWYIYDQTMFEGVISMPTYEIKGNKPIYLIRNETDGWDPGISTPLYRLPNVLAYKMNPAAGWSPTAASPINLMARKMYAELSASNAKTSQYAPEDIAMCILALGQIIAITEHCRRTYGVMNYFNFFNRAVPETIVKGLGFDYDQVRSNLSDFRARMNTIIARLDTIQFPANIPYFKQSDYIYKNLFVDRDDKMPTYHFMTPNSTWIIREDLDPDGTVLETVAPVGDSWTQWCDLLDNMITNVLTSATFNYVFADVINLINRNVLSNQTITVEPIAIDYTITPLYSEQFNWQIMNMHILGEPSTKEYVGRTVSNNVYANTDAAAVIYAPAFEMPGNDALMPVPVRIPDIDIDHKEFVECLAYFSPYALTKRDTMTIAKDVALSTYYCALTSVYYPLDDGTIGSTDYRSNWESGSFWWTSNPNQPNFGYITEPIHTPFFGLYTGVGRAIPLTKIGTFTQVARHPVENLRYQTNLALFRYKD